MATSRASAPKEPQAEPRATATVTLTPWNTVSLALSTATHLVIPGGGAYYLQMVNLGTGNVFIKGDQTVAAADAASYKLPANASIAPLVRGGIWVLADAAGALSVALLPKP